MSLCWVLCELLTHVTVLPRGGSPGEIASDQRCEHHAAHAEADVDTYGGSRHAIAPVPWRSWRAWRWRGRAFDVQGGAGNVRVGCLVVAGEAHHVIARVELRRKGLERD